MAKGNYYVYIITNKNNTTFYIGVTNNLERRILEHKNELINGFSKKYKLKKLIYFEEYVNVIDTITREKQLKNWHREWKINLIRRILNSKTCRLLSANRHSEFTVSFHSFSEEGFQNLLQILKTQRFHIRC